MGNQNKMTFSSITIFGANPFSFSPASYTSNFIGTVAPTTIYTTTTTTTLTSKIMKRMITKIFHLKMYNKAIPAAPITLLNKDNVPAKIEKKMTDHRSFTRQIMSIHNTTTTTTLTTKIMNRMITKLFHLKKYNKVKSATPITSLKNKENS